MKPVTVEVTDFYYWPKNFLREELTLTNLYVNPTKPATKIEAGDKVTVTFEGEVTYVSPFSGLADVKPKDGSETRTAAVKDMKVTEKKLPPEPKIGSSVLYNGKDVYVRQADGWHQVKHDGKLGTYAVSWVDFRDYDGTFLATPIGSAK